MKELQVLTNALDAAIKAGVFNLQDAGSILQSINALGAQLKRLEGLDEQSRKAKENGARTFSELSREPIRVGEPIHVGEPEVTKDAPTPTRKRK